MKEFSRHLNRLCNLKIDKNKVKVFLCGGYGDLDNKDHIDVQTVFPEHMWFEIETTNGYIYIDTFPKTKNITIAKGFKGPPGEPNRITYRR